MDTIIENLWFIILIGLIGIEHPKLAIFLLLIPMIMFMPHTVLFWVGLISALGVIIFG